VRRIPEGVLRFAELSPATKLSFVAGETVAQLPVMLGY